MGLGAIGLVPAFTGAWERRTVARDLRHRGQCISRATHC